MASDSAAIRPKVVRIDGESIVEALNKPLTKAGHRFTLAGWVKAWEVREGAHMGVRVKKFKVESGGTCGVLVMELEPAR